MATPEAAQILKQFYENFGDAVLKSTSATVVQYPGTLYNVDGSTDDPKIDGVTWKQLLIDNGINGNCYVTSPLPTDDSSHPSFNVGGHMTPNSDGSVAIGGICYLMPLCSWHNSKQRDGVPFAHTETTMLQLSGYMQAEPAATFLARQPGDAPYTMVGADGTQLTVHPIGKAQVAALKTARPLAAGEMSGPAHYLIFRQVHDGDAIRYVIDHASLP